MKIKNRITTAVTLLLIVSSCSVISFYPLYTKDVLITNHHILGKWVYVGKGEKQDTIIWEISLLENLSSKAVQDSLKKSNLYTPNKYPYTLSLKNKQSKNPKKEFVLHLIELEGENYIDFYPISIHSNKMGVPPHSMSVHTFAKINISKDSITINWFDAEWLSKKLKEKKIRIKHENNNEDILLTAHPKELQKFVAKYVNDKNAFEDGFKRTLKPLK